MSEGGKIVMILSVMGGVASLKIVGFADRCQECSWDNMRKGPLLHYLITALKEIIRELLLFRNLLAFVHAGE